MVDEERKVVGIVSESDLILSDEESDLHLPHYLNIMGGIVFVGSMKGFEKRLDKAFATKVSELMTADPVVVHDYASAETVAKTIADKHHNHLPVVDDEGRLAGMVTRADALAALVDELSDGAGGRPDRPRRGARKLRPAEGGAGRWRGALRGGQGRRLRPRRRRLRRGGAGRRRDPAGRGDRGRGRADRPPLRCTCRC